MNRTEHLLTVLGEEGAEVAQRVSKALRFGLEEVQPGQPDDNAERIRFEVYDLIGTYMILAEEQALPPLHLDAELVERFTERKRTKIETFMAISRREGVLQG